MNELTIAILPGHATTKAPLSQGPVLGESWQHPVALRSNSAMGGFGLFCGCRLQACVDVCAARLEGLSRLSGGS